MHFKGAVDHITAEWCQGEAAARLFGPHSGTQSRLHEGLLSYTEAQITPQKNRNVQS